MNYKAPALLRFTTNKVLAAIEEGLLDRDTVILAGLNYMSESDVLAMANCNEFFGWEEEEEDEILEEE
jgi:hypothetical protein